MNKYSCFWRHMPKKSFGLDGEPLANFCYFNRVCHINKYYLYLRNIDMIGKSIGKQLKEKIVFLKSIKASEIHEMSFLFS